MIDQYSLMLCLVPAETTIVLSEKVEKRKGIGLIPIGQPVSGVRTEGLKWDITPDMELSMLGLISSSNEALQQTVKITTPKPLIWCTSLTWAS